MLTDTTQPAAPSPSKLKEAAADVLAVHVDLGDGFCRGCFMPPDAVPSVIVWYPCTVARWAERVLRQVIW